MRTVLEPMPPECKGRCNKESKFGGYVFGDSKCTLCNVFYKTNSLKCYCCNGKLRKTSRWNRVRIVARIEA